MYGPHSPFTREILNAMASSIGTFIPYDWWILIKALLKQGEYPQWTMWFQNIARDHANKNAWAGALQNRITSEMLTDTGQFDAIKAQLQCPPLLCGQLKTMALEAWDKITPQEKPTGSYTKILQGPNETYADFLAIVKTAISCTVIGEKVKRQLREITCLWKCKSGMSKGYSSNSWDKDYYYLKTSQSRIRNSKDAKARWSNGCCLKKGKWRMLYPWR